MLSFLGRRRQYCDGISRRDFLRVGALSVGGLSLADMLRLQGSFLDCLREQVAAEAATAPRDPVELE